VAAAFPDGGWTAEANAESWPTPRGPEPQRYGVSCPPLDLE